MIQKISKSLLVLALLAMGQTLTACTNSQFLKAMDLSVTEQNNDAYINLSTEVSLGNIAIASAQIAITDPNTKVEYGQIAFSTAADGNQQVTLSLNETAVTAGSTSLGNTLPNGRVIPTGTGVNTAGLIGIPVLNNSMVYVGGDLKTKIVIGMAVTISAFDSLSVIGNSNIFFQGTFNTSLSGLAGLYTSTTPNQSGIAIFAEYTAPTTTTVPATPVTAAAASAKVLVSNKTSTPTTTTIAASGKFSSKQYNTKYTDGADTNGEQTAYSYFYGKKRVVKVQ
jgi:hypothetical protein